MFENGNKKTRLTVSLLRESVPFVGSEEQKVLVGPDNRSLTYLYPEPPAAGNTDLGPSRLVMTASEGLDPEDPVIQNMDFEQMLKKVMAED